MSGHWEGFTEEDIRKIGIGGPKAVQNRSSLGTKQPSNSFRQQQQAKKNVNRGKMVQNVTEPSQLSESKPLMTDLGPESLLSRPDPSSVAKMNGMSELVTVSLDHPESVLLSTPPPLSPTHIPVCIRIKDGRNYEVIEAQKTSLEDFQKRQKLMEEQNRHRKELLGRALADKKKQTHAEAQRLQQIQEELQKLDSLLSNDVSILRNQIEVASLEFSEAQKRYNKAEKEFLDAKMIMFGKLEQKELLTEHLCTIIEQNEMRKAKKLSELMDKLELGTIVLSEIIANATTISPSPPESSQNGVDKLSIEKETTAATVIEPEPEAAQIPMSSIGNQDVCEQNNLAAESNNELKKSGFTE